VSSIEQRGAVAFTGAGIAAAVILMTPCGAMCSSGRGKTPALPGARTPTTAIPEERSAGGHA
jgi:hypothetical protein